MKKTIILLLIAVTCANAVQAQDLVIPVKKLNQTCADTSLFNFRPSTVLLRNIGAGDTVTNLKFYYEITDSAAAKTPHSINGVPYTRSNNIVGNAQLPILIWLAITIPSMNTTGYTSEQLLNGILQPMDMLFDNQKPIIYGGKPL